MKELGINEIEPISRLKKLIGDIETAVEDIVAHFVSQPEIAIHEGIIRPCIMALEAALNDGMKRLSSPSSNSCEWVDDGYWQFLRETKNVLRNDHGVIQEAESYIPPKFARHLGWGNGRAMLFMALNENLLGKAIENLIKRRTIVESYYEESALFYNYEYGKQVVSLLSAFNGVNFNLSILKEDVANNFPENLLLKDEVDDNSNVLTIFTTNASVESIKTFNDCTPCRFLFHSLPLEEVHILRGSWYEQPIFFNQGEIIVWQFLLKSYNISFNVLVNDKEMKDPIRYESPQGFMEGAVQPCISSHQGVCTLRWDNSYSYVRGKDIQYRYIVIEKKEYIRALISARDAAEILSWRFVLTSTIPRISNEQEQLRKEEENLLKKHILARENLEKENSSSTKGFSIIGGTLSYVLGSGYYDQNNKCNQCHIEFSLFRRRSNCVRCKKTFCLSCSTHFICFGSSQGRVCDRCFLKTIDEKQSDYMNQEQSSKYCEEYEKLKKESSLEKYFKMLSFGVPHSAVGQKMKQDLVDQSIIKIFLNGPEGEEGMKMNHKEEAVTTKSKIQRSSSSLRKVHWKSLDASKAENSVWQRQTTLRKAVPAHASAWERQELENLFGEKQRISSTSKKKSILRSGRLLDPRRSNSISIGLSQFKLIGGGNVLVNALLEADTSILTAERLTILLDIVPTEVEVRRFKNFNSNTESLGEAEKFLIAMTKVSRAAEKVAALLYSAQFTQQVMIIRDQIEIISIACQSILESERFARVLETILVIGNIMNIGTEREDATGITLDSLQKLSETRSIDGSVTLLDFLVEMLQEKGEGENLEFPDDMQILREAKSLSNSICFSLFKDLEKGMFNFQRELDREKRDDFERFNESEKLRYEKVLRMQEKAREKKQKEKEKEEINMMRQEDHQRFHTNERRNDNKAIEKIEQQEELSVSKKVERNPPSNRLLLLESIKNRSNNPSRTSLLSSIRSRKQFDSKKAKIEEEEVSSNPSDYTFKPGEYHPNALITKMEEIKPNLLQILEELTDEVERMMSCCKEVAEYLGEHSLANSSGQIFSTIYDFILKTNKSKAKAKRSKHIQQFIGKVGQLAPTIYGCGVIESIRVADRIYIVKYSWGRCYMEAHSFLHRGEVIQCPYGLGVLEKNLWETGQCIVRLPWSRATISVLLLKRSKTTPEVLKNIYSCLLPGDLARTSFGEARTNYRRLKDDVLVVSYPEKVKGYFNNSITVDSRSAKMDSPKKNSSSSKAEKDIKAIFTTPKCKESIY